MGIIAAGQITVVDLSDAPVLNAFITASRPTTQTYSKDSRNYNPSYASTPQVLTLNVTKSGSTTSIIDSISGLHWFVVDGSVKTEITSKVNTSNEYISGTYDENLTTKLNIDTNKGYRRYEATGVWRDPSTDLDVQFSADIDLLLTQNGATGPQGPQGDEGPKGETGNGIANTVVTYGLSMSDTTEPATWSSDRPALVKGMYLWTRTVIIYTNGESTTSYQISYIPKDADESAIDKAKQELLEKLETVRDESLEAVDEAKQQLVTVRDESLAAAEEAKQQVTTVANELSTAKQDFQNAVSAVDTKATNLQSDLTQAKQDLASQAQQLQEQAGAQSELTNRVSSVEETANGTKTTVSELSKTVDQNGKDITSVTARTKVVEDDLSGTKTTLSQVKTTADSASQKTATLETGLNGLTAKFNSLSVGAVNLFKGSRDFNGSNWINNYNGIYAEDYQGVKIFKTQDMWVGRSQYFEVKAGEEYVFSAYVKSSAKTDRVAFYLPHEPKQPVATGLVGFDAANSQDALDFDLTDEYQRIAIKVKITKNGWIAPRIERFNSDNYLFFGGYKLERGTVATDYTPNESDLEQKVAEYKQNADQNYASLQTTVQNLDGTVQHNKTVADQTAQGFSTRIESLETYKNGESTRANQYFELAKTETARQLTAERTAIAKDYVAKSTYTSDVTGIRNDLTATTTTANTTKTNLANYQASNDRAVANLQSNLQTANGNISSLKTKVEAVPGQITSAVSAVEGKIPTSVGAVNLFKGSRDFSGSWMNAGSGVYTEDYKGVKIFKRQNVWYGLSQYFEVKTGEEYVFSAYVRSSAKTDGVNFYLVHESKQPMAEGVASFGSTNSTNNVNIDLTDEYQRIAIKIKITKDGWIAPRIERYNSDHYLLFGGYKLERGTVATDWSPSPEDTVSQISSLSSQIQQTADGMTLLATKTELNSAKNEVQSGINTATNKANAAQNTANNNAQTISTHTTQISALNTGLQAKVSQSEFNTLSGRVTTAENNITAKANELSSKITSVEGKIPTSSGGRNLAQGTSKDWSKPFTGFSGNQNTCPTLYRVTTDGLVVGDTFKTRIVLKYTDIRPASGKTAEIWVQGAGNVTAWNSGAYPSGGGGRRSISGSGQIVFELTDKINADHLKNSYWDLAFRTDWIASGSLQWKLAKAERGMFFTDWSPAPEDTIEQISSLSSELKQTKDGITLLATKTELNTAKSDLQSGINTATNKANSAQSTANNNAQTISTHTNQISALNTGLSAKVSQSEFNTLSGRVTTAENNITAKANELSSKITSVEGKIPTSVGAVNLFKGSRDFNGSNWINNYNGIYAEDYQGVKIFKTQDMWVGRSQYFEVKAGEEYVFSAYVKSSAKTDGITFYLFHDSKQPMAGGIVNNNRDSVGLDLTDKYQRIVVKIKITSTGWIMPRLERYNSNAYLFFGGYKLERGNIATDWSPAPEDYDSKLAAAQSEFKQTTDAIKASVSSLDKSTVKSSSLTINSDGIVMKAGKSTTDVANAIGSYFAVNQNAIDLFADKIKVKGNMIVNGTITGDKIKASSVDVSKIVGIDANFIKSKIEYAMIDWLKGKTITAYNGNMTIDLQNGRISFKDGSNAVYRQTSDGIHTGFLHFEAGSQGGVYAAFGTTSTRQGINSKSSEFAGIRCYRVSANGDSHAAKIDKIEVIGDTVQFGHTYHPNGTIGGGFIMQTAAYYDDPPYSLNRMVSSIESLWRILYVHGANVGYNLSHPNFINALRDEYNAWHDMHNR